MQQEWLIYLEQLLMFKYYSDYVIYKFNSLSLNTRNFEYHLAYL